MKREFLEGLGIPKEAIDKIMAENGNDIENARASEKAKYEAERTQAQAQVTDLQNQLAQRDTDLAALNDQLVAAQADAGKLTEAQTSLQALQSKYDKAQKDWTAKTAAQAREYAVRAAAAELKFSSGSAKRAFIHDAIADPTVKLDGEALLGYQVFLQNYQANDPGAFAKEKEPEPAPAEPAPTIVLPGKSAHPRKAMSLSDMMRAKNQNPNFVIDFGK